MTTERPSAPTVLAMTIAVSVLALITYRLFCSIDILSWTSCRLVSAVYLKPVEHRKMTTREKDATDARKSSTGLTYGDACT